MRDAKLLFHEEVAPATASLEVDMGAREPGVGVWNCYLSATYDITGATAPTGPVTVTLTTADEPGGTYRDAGTVTIPAAKAALGGAILSTPIPDTCGRYLKTAWDGLTGGLITDGIDWGIKDGTPALDQLPY